MSLSEILVLVLIIGSFTLPPTVGFTIGEFQRRRKAREQKREVLDKQIAELRESCRAMLAVLQSATIITSPEFVNSLEYIRDEAVAVIAKTTASQ